jgi:hypothetical protein
MSKYQLSPTSKHHVIVIQRVAGVIGMTIPALYIENEGRPYLFTSLVKYFLKHPQKSTTWKRQTSKALGLFFDFWKAVNEQYKNQLSHQEVMRRFGIALSRGTVNPETQADPLKLFWPSISVSNTKKLLSSLQQFTAWCIDEGLVIQASPLTQNTSSSALTEVSTLRFLRQALKIKSFSFFGHSMQSSSLAMSLANKKRFQPIDLGIDSNTSSISEAKTFPSELVPELLQYGFILDETSTLPWDREDLTAKMITILQLFGGARKSEPFHLWFNDVIPQFDGSCKVFFRHPSESKTYIPGDEDLTRKQFLASLGLYPRNSEFVSKSYHAGWKNLSIDQTYSAPLFFIHPSAESLFKNMFLTYLRYRQELISIHTSAGNPDHPFLFISKSKGHEGKPYSISSYEKALRRAYKRLEKRMGISIPWSKYHGTTPHGMRHFYGQALVDAGMNSKIIQKCMRHKSVLSQAVYTEPRNKQIHEALEKASRRLDSGKSETLTSTTIEVLNSHA